MAVCLVTGGAGFIGSHLTEALVENRHEVRVLDNLSTGALENLDKVLSKVRVITADITDPTALNEAIQGVDLLFHHVDFGSVQGSITDPLSAHYACATATLQVLLAAREVGVKRVIYAASANAYGNPERLPIRETDRLHPLSPYAVAKLTGEQYCETMTQLCGLETVRLRYFNVYGPRQLATRESHSVIPRFVENLRAGRSPVIYGDGLQTRDFTYVEDVVQANLLASKASRVAGKVYNIGFGAQTTLLELVSHLNAILGTNLKPIHTAPRPGEARHRQANTSLAQADLGYCPCFDIKEGLQRYVTYYCSVEEGARSREGDEVAFKDLVPVEPARKELN
jgi:UDP-glucose 4-epimerase